MKLSTFVTTSILCAAYLVAPNQAQTPSDQSAAGEKSAYTRRKPRGGVVVVVSEPQPGYTVEAKSNDVTGTVTLCCVLHSSSTITNVAVVKGLPDGLTEQAIEAARQLKFTPAVKDNRNVSQYATINYTFELYDDEDDPQVTRKAVILEQSAAEYTDEAKARRIEGTVVLLVRLGRDGKAHVASVVRGLPNGLTERVMAAAREISYEFKLNR